MDFGLIHTNHKQITASSYQNRTGIESYSYPASIVVVSYLLTRLMWARETSFEWNAIMMELYVCRTSELRYRGIVTYWCPRSKESIIFRLPDRFCTPLQQQWSGTLSAPLGATGTNYSVPHTRTKFGHRAFSVARPVVWNSLPAAVRHADSLHSFKCRLKSHFLACVLMIDSVMPLRSGFARGGH